MSEHKIIQPLHPEEMSEIVHEAAIRQRVAEMETELEQAAMAAKGRVIPETPAWVAPDPIDWAPGSTPPSTPQVQTQDPESFR